MGEIVSNIVGLSIAFTIMCGGISLVMISRRRVGK